MCFTDNHESIVKPVLVVNDREDCEEAIRLLFRCEGWSTGFEVAGLKQSGVILLHTVRKRVFSCNGK